MPSAQTSELAQSRFVSIFFFLAVALFILGRTPFSHLYFAVTNTLVAPLEKFTYKAGSKAGREIDFWRSIRIISKEDRALRVQYAQVLSQNAKFEALSRENEALRTQIASYGVGTIHQTEVQIIGLGSDMKINAGREKGIKAGDPVVLGNWLVGQVESVQPGLSHVRLTSSAGSHLAVAAGSGAKGVALGQFGVAISMEKVLPSELLSVGDLVTTTGDNDRIPRGLVVGKIAKVDKNDAAIFQTAAVVPLAPFADLESVFVLTSL